MITLQATPMSSVGCNPSLEKARAIAQTCPDACVEIGMLKYFITSAQGNLISSDYAVITNIPVLVSALVGPVRDANRRLRLVWRLPVQITISNAI